MEESILTSIKKLLGINEDDDSFDTDIIIHINSTLMILNQISVTPKFHIIDDSETWGDYLTNINDIEMVKTYIYMKVKIIFDPPLSSSALDAMKQSINEYEWRLSVVSAPTVTP